MEWWCVNGRVMRYEGEEIGCWDVMMRERWNYGGGCGGLNF